MVRIIALLLTASLAACAGSASSPQVRKPQTPAEFAKAEFDKRAVSTAVPAALREAAAGFVLKRLLEPSSAQFRFDYSVAVGSQTAVCGAVNGKNGEGAYVGFQRFFVLVEAGVARDGTIAENEVLTPRFIALCDQSHPDHPSYPLRALQREEGDEEPAGVS